MTRAAPRPSTPPAAAPAPLWSSGPARDALELIAEGVTELAGFKIAAISVARDDGQLELLAVAGDDEARESLQGRRTPIAQLMAELDKADEWGLLRFVPHERLDAEGVGETWGYVPEMQTVEGADAWHPMDLLIAPLYDQAGVLRGTLAIDVPLDGRRPNEAQRRVLQKYAEQAGRAVLTTLEREALAERVRLAEAARGIVRRASAQLNLDRILAESRQALVDGFGALGLWLQLFDQPDDDGTGSVVHTADGSSLELSDELVEIARTAATAAWEQQRVEVVTVDQAEDDALTGEDHANVMGFLTGIGVTSILFVPLGAGPECFGNLVLTRGPGAPDWTDDERATALDIGHDLGRAILNARTFEREHHLVQELRALDDYKGQLIATVAHELRNPLTSVTGHLELLDGMQEVPPHVRSSLQSMERGARRMGRVIEDLLLLSKVGDPSYPITAVPVDLRRTLEDAVDLTSVAAQRKGVDLRMDLPDSPVLALGDAEELRRVCANLVSNAVKYTRSGGAVVARLSMGDGVAQMEICDEGLGISPADQQRLFQEFFRSTNPDAVAEPGTGLGLTIVKRILDRHDGRVTVESELGEGSRFTVTLPAG